MFASATIRAFLLCAPFVDGVKVLLIGSSRSFKTNEEPPFQFAKIADHLKDFGIDTLTEDVYTSKNLDILAGSGSTVWANMPHYLYSLAQYMFWPEEEGKAQRDQLLQGTSSNGKWDFVVLLHDPYILSRMPGYFAEGVKMVSDKVKAGGAVPLLFMQWPGPSSSANVSTFIDITYRVGAGAGLRVVPGGKAWQSHGDSSAGAAGEHPAPDGALMAAAAIYSEITDKSAADKLSDAANQQLADQVLAVVQQERCESHVSGAFTLKTPFSMGQTKQTGEITMCHTGSSSERGITKGLVNVAKSFDGASITQKGCNDKVDFNLGRGNSNFEANKRYKVDAKWPLSFGFPMQERKDGAIESFPYGLDHRQWHANDLDICEHMIKNDEVSQGARCVPIRLMYNKMKEEDSGITPSGDNWHMSGFLDYASGSYIYTLASRQKCKQGGEPEEKYTDSWRKWLGQRIGCETAWRLATLADDSGDDLSPSCSPTPQPTPRPSPPADTETTLAGCPKRKQSKVPQQQTAVSQTLPFRCCRGRTYEWVEMRVEKGGYGCNTGTYSEAIDKCVEKNLTLCTAAQMDSQCGTGCSFDKERVWSLSGSLLLQKEGMEDGRTVSEDEEMMEDGHVISEDEMEDGRVVSEDEEMMEDGRVISETWRVEIDPEGQLHTANKMPKAGHGSVPIQKHQSDQHTKFADLVKKVHGL